MNDDEEIVFELPDDALAEAAKAGDALAFDIGHGWTDRTQKERAGEADALEPMSDDSWLQGVEVQLHIGKFRHNLQAVSYP